MVKSQIDEKFSLAPEQTNLERDYKMFLQEHFNIVFNNLFTITNLPVGRTKMHLERRKLYSSYLQFLESHFNPSTLEHLMCRDELSIDYLGNVYDCDFNQMMNLPAKNRNGKTLTVSKLLEAGSLDLISEIQTAAYCYGCTAGCGSSCGGALLERLVKGLGVFDLADLCLRVRSLKKVCYQNCYECLVVGQLLYHDI